MKALQNTAVRRRTRARRARALTAPCGIGLPMSSQVPVPKMYAFCNDASVLGVPFYVLEFVEGPLARNRPTSFALRAVGEMRPV